MNILYIHTHDTGRYIEPYGYMVSTPNLMKLAEEGVTFRQAFCTGPTCSPSRAGLLTGMAPHSCGMLGLAHRGFKLNDYGKHIINQLKKTGYQTVLCGVQHIAPKDKGIKFAANMIGYNKVIEGDVSSTTAENSLKQDLSRARVVADFIKKKREKPFFLSFGMRNTHRSSKKEPEPAEGIKTDFIRAPYTVPDNKENRRDMASFMTRAKCADECVGIVLDALKKSGQEKNTLVIFTTDHGIAFPNMKATLYDPGIGIALIMRYPDVFERGKVIDSMVSHIDVYPTICDLTGIDKPEWLQGTSMLSLIRGEKDSIRDEIFSEMTYHASYEPLRCIRTDRYKYIKFFDSHNKRMPVHLADCPSKEMLLQYGYYDIEREKEQLFDLYLDPVERINLIDDKRYSSVYEDLKNRLKKWMEETGDPLLNGQVEKPEGAFYNKIDCISPHTPDYK